MLFNLAAIFNIGEPRLVLGSSSVHSVLALSRLPKISPQSCTLFKKYKVQSEREWTDVSPTMVMFDGTYEFDDAQYCQNSYSLSKLSWHSKNHK